MVSFRKLLITFGTVLAFQLPLFGGHAMAAALPQPCQQVQLDVPIDKVELCDLSVDKQVSVNGGAYVEADTAGAAAAASVGDTITWKITVTNNSSTDLSIVPLLYIYDLLPSAVTFQSYTATAGTYKPHDGSFFQDNWILPTQNAGTTTLPATLIITTKATTAGLAQNTAIIAKFDNLHCDGGCLFSDNIADNNQNDAFANIQNKVFVLGTSTTNSLPNTGANLVPSILAGLLIIGTLGLSVASRHRQN